MLVGFWFGVIAVLWAGFFLLEGFDFGVGMLLPFVGRTGRDRDIAIGAIGPVWDGNEVWLLVAGGATFAAFPEWYASVFSGFYLAFALLLVGLILRGVGIEYRGKAQTERGRRWCEAAFVGGSAVPALLLGVAFANFLGGVDLDRAHVMTGSFVALLKPYALLGGLTTLSIFALHGAVFLALRTTGPVAEAAQSIARRLVWPTGLIASGFLIWTTEIRSGLVSRLIGVVIVIGLVAVIRGVLFGRFGWAFAASALVTALIPIWAFAALWPNVLPASNGAALSLTAHQASSTQHTLWVMTGVALVVTPIVLAYQTWTYWVFRGRIGAPLPNYTSSAPVVAAARQAAQRFGTTREPRP